MLEPQNADNEQGRLETLRALNVLDTPSEARFDRLTRMAKRMFDVPIALVSLVDENRQWFKSCMGLPVLETPRNISFCGHAILGDGIFLIPDATRDERFADNPLVTGDPHIRFYAGCPLRAPNGDKLGTLCIIDCKPRQFTEEDLDTLRDLAGMVESELAALQLATVDELTGIPNRRGLMMLGQNSLSICARQNVPATLVFCDLNDFKSINDTFGHSEGDRVLTVFAEGLKSSFRSSDLVARLGGDEFVVLLTSAGPAMAIAAVEKFRDALNLYNQKSEVEYKVCFASGIVQFDPDRHPTIDALLSDADSRMYQNKNRRYCEVAEDLPRGNPDSGILAEALPARRARV